MAGALLPFGISPAYGQSPDEASLPERALTNIFEIWQLPKTEQAVPHRIRTEVVVYYFDADWGVAFGECHGTPAYLPIADSKTPLKPGQRIALDGVIRPLEQSFVWDKTQVRVLEDKVALKPVAIQSLSSNSKDLRSRLVLVDGLVDRIVQRSAHFTLNFLAGGDMATVQVYAGSNAPVPNFAAGDFVRLKCVYSPQFDRNGNLSAVALWVASPEDIEVIGSVSKDRRFATPITHSEDIQQDVPASDLVHVEGVVHSYEPGKSVTLWDETGQVIVQSKQTQPLHPGDRVEAIGHPYVVGVQYCLHDGLYRLVASTHIPVSTAAGAPKTLRLTEQVRELSREDARRSLPVKLRATVTWNHNSTPFTYVLDGSGGIRIVNPNWESDTAAISGAIVEVEGVTCEGDYVPAITNAVLRKVGWWSPDEARTVTLEQALTGVEEGGWVEMSGFVRNVTQRDGLFHCDMGTSRGDFQVSTPASAYLDNLTGSIIRVRGVCTAIANARHQLTGIQILAPEVANLQVEESKPDDLFAVPLRTLDALRRFNTEIALNHRVRTSGTVVLHEPGRHLYVQDGFDSVFAMSQQSDPLRPGDRVEVVGFPGYEGRRFVLREAVYRRMSGGKEPAPVQLTPGHSVNPDWEGVLAKAEGTLHNLAKKEDEARLVIHNKDTTFEAVMDLTRTDRAKDFDALEAGSRLAITGVYDVQSDDYGKPRSFLLRLRSASDVHLIQGPPWWTLARLLWLLLGVLVVSLAALAWGFVIARNNKLLTHARAELEVAKDNLELRVLERTRELQEQMAARERTRAELAEAQQNLVVTSRQAGMAEMATGVLHNVGNVLNSVNVAAGLLDQRLHNSHVEMIGKAAALLKEQQGQLAGFLTEDPRGKALPGFLEKVAEVLIQEKLDMQNEVKSLTKNIDHIKVIVSVQQSYAKVGGTLEEVELKDLAEDAIQINGAALEREGVELIRNYQHGAPVLVDRHMVLQILVNLLSNAWHALVNTKTGRQVTVIISQPAPDRVRLSIADNGMGIAPENLGRIFAQGFTTRKEGHGFGLHSCVKAANDMGGSISAESLGLGKGAVFILELPTRKAAEACNSAIEPATTTATDTPSTPSPADAPAPHTATPPAVG